MFLFYVQSFFTKGYIIQGGTLFKGGHYLMKYGNRLFKQKTIYSPLFKKCSEKELLVRGFKIRENM